MAAPPCPRANPALGSALDLRRSQIRTYERVMREHGDVVRLVVGPPGLRSDLYCVFHPDGVKAVLAGSRASYSKGTRFYQQIAEAFGRGLLTSEGELGQRQQRLVQPLFTRKQIATYSELMPEEAAAVAKRWIAPHETARASTSTPRWSGWRYEWSRGRSSATTWSGPATCSNPPSRCSTGTRSGAQCRLWRRRRPGRPRTTAGRRGPAGTLRTGRRADRAPPAGRSRWRGPPVVAAARPQSEHGRQRTTMAIKDAMRLYPPAYALGRRSETENEIGGYSIPAGACIVVSQSATHRDPRFWDDADAFDPTRFTPERERARHPHAYFPFGGGARACIGSHFAMLEAVIAMGVVLQRFRISSDQDTVPLDTADITLRPKGAVPIRLAARLTTAAARAQA
jgi:cytochrome P450